MTTPPKPLSNRVKPTAETKFQIDYEWWKREGRDLRAYLISHLPPEQRPLFENTLSEEMRDHVDPATAEVRRVDALQHALAQAVNDPQFITDRTPLVDAIFRVFLANGNRPLSPEELSKPVGRSPLTILKTIAGGQVYKGIRPVQE